jgi:hypothetical protein
MPDAEQMHATCAKIDAEAIDAGVPSEAAMRALFAEIDTNGDGTLDQAELVAFAASRRGACLPLCRFMPQTPASLIRALRVFLIVIINEFRTREFLSSSGSNMSSAWICSTRFIRAIGGRCI